MMTSFCAWHLWWFWSLSYVDEATFISHWIKFWGNIFREINISTLLNILLEFFMHRTYSDQSLSYHCALISSRMNNLELIFPHHFVWCRPSSVCSWCYLYISIPTVWCFFFLQSIYHIETAYGSYHFSSWLIYRNWC